MLREEFWVLGLDWNGPELKKCNSIFNGGMWFQSRVILAFEAWEMYGIPYFIYNNGDGSVWWENERGLMVELEEDKMGDLWRKGGYGSDPFSPSTQFVFILAWNWRDKDFSNIDVLTFIFNHFGKNLTFYIASGLITWAMFPTKLTCKHVLEFFGMCLGSEGINTKWLNDLVHQKCKFWMSGLVCASW